MKRLRYKTRRIRARIRSKWMACRIAAAEKKRCSHENTPSCLKEMWDSYLSFAQLEFQDLSRW